VPFQGAPIDSETEGVVPALACGGAFSAGTKVVQTRIQEVLMIGHLSDGFYNPVPCGLGELEAGFEVVANSLCRGGRSVDVRA